MTLSYTLAAHVTETPFEALPSAAVEAAKRSLLDAIGVSLGASGLEPSCAPFIDLALAAGGAPTSTILGAGRRAPALYAALANGALAHALDFEDAFDEAPLHPNAALVPAALALAEARRGVNGREFLAALVLGCDVTCRLALAARVQAHDRGWYPPPIYAAYGAVAASCRVLGLSAAQTVDAFSLALSQATCSGEIKNNPQSSFRAVRDAFPAQAGVLSAELAQRGVTGFAQPFEGEFGFFRLFTGEPCDAEKLLDRLGERFTGAEVSFKPWPSCRGTHAFIEIALALRTASPFELSNIERLDLRGADLLRMLMNPFDAKCAPTTAIDAKFSLPFVVGAALMYDRVNLETFLPDRLCEEKVRTLARCVRLETAPGFSAAAGEMTIVLRDGRQLRGAVDEARGGLANPMSWDDIVSKAKLCAAHAKAPISGVSRLVEAIATLERADDAGAALSACLTPSA